uniref:Altered inheritance of mitochondria protein 44-like n=1 Tax=Nicotiana sylvestris TaxID=4096 RepID=A0A1U7XWM3_NICSY|nr:PREDICTED: altered inheritance of mitochondria protein 44-like [Nicotiana sylvestris]
MVLKVFSYIQVAQCAFWGKVREAAEKKVLKEQLLAALRTQSGVQYDDPSEEVLMASRHIDERQASNVAGPSHIPGSSAYASSSIPNRTTSIEEDLDHIRHFQAYQVKHNQAIAEMLRTMALHHGMNMDNFPTCPSYTPPRGKTTLDEDEDEDEDDDDDDAEEEEDDDDDEE